MLRATAGLSWELVAVVSQPELLLDSFAALHSHDQVQLLQAPAGGSAASSRNLALRHSRAATIACLRAGERCSADRFSLPLQLLDRHPEVQVVCSGWQVGSQPHTPWQRPLGWGASERLQDPCLPASALTIRRSALDQLGGFHGSMPAWSGTDLVLRMTAAGGLSAWLAELLVSWRPLEQAQPWSVAALHQGLEQLLQRHGEGLRPEQLLERRFAVLTWCAGLAWQQQQPQQARDLLIQAALSAPLPTPRAVAQLLEQFSRSERWIGQPGDPRALMASELWTLSQRIWR